MSEELYHHGIKGMKWGVRRTPEELGHAVAGKKTAASGGKTGKDGGKKTPGKAARKSTSISDDELRKRIERLNLEERYDDLVARKKTRENTGFKATAKKLLANAGEDLGRQLLSKAVSKLVDRIAGDKKFNIDDYKDMDVDKMDADTIAKVSKWYGDAMKINTSRSRLTPEPPKKKDPPASKPESNTQRASREQMDDWIRQRNRALRDLGR